jgi:translation initiation factor 2 alpha subunit (eIF-2alpha)
MKTETVRVQLNFPLTEVNKHLIWHLGHEYGLIYSIRKANIDIHTGGYTVLDLTGPLDKIKSALAWAQQEGVEVQTLGIDGNDEWVVK